MTNCIRCISPRRELAALLFAITVVSAVQGAGSPELKCDDVVAFVGGADVAASQHSGHLEALLAIQFPGARFRNFGWEGDTVFERPRMVGFPSLKTHLERAGVSVVFLQFGRAEVLEGRHSLPAFVDAFEKLLDELAPLKARLVLVTPPPFENAGGTLLPDLFLRNEDLSGHVDAIRSLAQKQKLPVVDLFKELGGVSHRKPRLTRGGLQLTERGEALLAAAFARQLGFAGVASRAGDPDENGVWPNARYERVRRAVVVKNGFWFDYWRPQNWAFLGGDRVSQPSSRDHRDPKVRWFPEEMEKFVPLIQKAELEIEEAAIAAK